MPYPFAPDDLSGLIFWWRADAGVTLSGSNIDSFADQSGNGNDGTAATANKAELRTGSSGTGGLPVAYFDSAQQRLYNLPINCLSGVTEAQIFFALKLDSNVPSAPNSGLCRFSLETTTGQLQAIYYPHDDNIIYDCFGGTARVSYAAGTGKDAWHRFCIKRNAAGYQSWRNNVSLFSNAVAGGSNWVSDPAIGGNTDTGGTVRRLKGSLLEVFMYDAVLSDTNRGTVDQYLADRISGEWYLQENGVPPPNWIRSTTGYTELIHVPDSDIRATTSYAEYIHSPESTPRVTDAYIEYIEELTILPRSTAAYIEYILQKPRAGQQGQVFYL